MCNWVVPSGITLYLYIMNEARSTYEKINTREAALPKQNFPVTAYIAPLLT